MSNAPLVKNQQSKSHNDNLDVIIDTWSEFTKVLSITKVESLLVRIKQLRKFNLISQGS